MKLRKWIFRGLLIVASTATIFCINVLYTEINLLAPSEQMTIDQLRNELLQVDSELKRLALQNRYGMAQNYDGIVRSTNRLQKISTRWIYEIRRSASMVWETVDSSPVVDAIDAQLERVELFKTSNARLLNSYRYMPEAVYELTSMTNSQELKFGSLKTAARDVMKSIFMLTSFRSSRDRDRLHTALAELAYGQKILRSQPVPGWRRAKFETLRNEVLARSEVVATNGLLCENMIPKVDTLLADIQNAPIPREIAKFDRIYQDILNKLNTNKSKIRLGIYSLTIMLAILLGGAGIILRRLYAGLERKVVERTASLQSLYRSNRVVLENVNEALITTSLGGTLSTEMSSVTEKWFQTPQPNESTFEWLGRVDGDFSGCLKLGFNELMERLLPEKIIFNQLPRLIHKEDATYQVVYTKIDEGRCTADTQVLLTIFDITEDIKKKEEERRTLEVMTLVKRIGRDRTGTLEFLVDSARLIERLSSSMSPVTAKRIIHTLKGNSATFSLHEFSSTCHLIEDRLDEEDGSLLDEEITRLQTYWSHLQDEIYNFTGESGLESLSVSSEDVLVLKEKLKKGASVVELTALVESWSRERVLIRLERAKRVLCGVAKHLGKPQPEVVLNDGGVRLDASRSSRWRDFWTAFVHVLRNTVDHGLETSEERIEIKKRVQGLVEIKVEPVADGIRLIVRDDGRGIDWDKVRAKAAEKGLPVDSQEDLKAALFHDGISSRDKVTTDSGRGVGMAAVKEATVALGGTIDIISQKGAGTTFIFQVPTTERSDELLSSVA